MNAKGRTEYEGVAVVEGEAGDLGCGHIHLLEHVQKARGHVHHHEDGGVAATDDLGCESGDTWIRKRDSPGGPTPQQRTPGISSE